MDTAQLQGASLGGELSLEFTQLQGASLDGANLQAASLDGAQLEGASVDAGTKLQGASLDGAQLQGASFSYAFVWRADARKAVWQNTRVVSPKTGPKTYCADQPDICEWKAETFQALKRLTINQVPEGQKRRDAVKRLESTLDPNKALEGEKDMARTWTDHAKHPPAREVYEQSVAELWRTTGCAADGAPYAPERAGSQRPKSQNSKRSATAPCRPRRKR